MRWAIVTSLIVHGFFISLVFKNSDGKATTYPRVIPVRLASMPVTKGVKKPAATESKSRKTKKTEKIETQQDKTRLAEVNRRKRPKKKQQSPKPAVEENEPVEEQIVDQNKGLPEGVELGSEFGSARLDAAGFDSPYYLNVIFSKIRNRWDNPYEGLDSVGCVIYFVVNRRGKISDSAIEKSSGYAAYDQAALRAVLAAKPPPLPNQFNSEELGIHLEFKYIPYN
ncbi:MAG: TonB family protein [candidate division Zixibacteria bacterium]